MNQRCKAAQSSDCPNSRFEDARKPISRPSQNGWSLPQYSGVPSLPSPSTFDMNRITRFPLLLCALLALVTSSAIAADQSHATTRVLFLGDKGHHRPAAFNTILQPALAKHDIEIVYTQDMNDLNSTNLARFDCLLVYANITRITPDLEKALFDFVAAGGGFAPIHCASFCFQNSTNCIALTGGQFQKHQTGVFKETIIKSDHPVMKGLTAIESWDETYVHTKHNTNRIVLAERRYAGTDSMAANLGNTDQSSGAEPYTWVREHGKGRVFYTAWGHDQRTWTNANFQALIESGIRWASVNSTNQVTRKN
jgi:type 1 glutamine amidotransferase